MSKKPKILVFDIETCPMLSYHWGLWDQNIALNQIKDDWCVLSWAAKWYGDSPKKVMYADQRKAKNLRDDKKILQGIWDLLNEADVVITQNGIKFDSKKLNARFAQNQMGRPSPYKHIDTCKIASKHFAFTSNKLEYLSDKLNKKYKKSKHGKFSGFSLWKACMEGNQKAWKEMEKYNKYDVLATEELYTVLQAWDTTIDFQIYNPEIKFACKCGSHNLIRKGVYTTKTCQYPQYRCKDCGSWPHDRSQNLVSKEKRKSLKGYG